MVERTRPPPEPALRNRDDEGWTPTRRVGKQGQGRVSRVWGAGCVSGARGRACPLRCPVLSLTGSHPHPAVWPRPRRPPGVAAEQQESTQRPRFLVRSVEAVRAAVSPGPGGRPGGRCLGRGSAELPAAVRGGTLRPRLPPPASARPRPRPAPPPCFSAWTFCVSAEALGPHCRGPLPRRPERTLDERSRGVRAPDPPAVVGTASGPPAEGQHSPEGQAGDVVGSVTQVSGLEPRAGRQAKVPASGWSEGASSHQGPWAPSEMFVVVTWHW